jgi:hypothetical protein
MKFQLATQIGTSKKKMSGNSLDIENFFISPQPNLLFKSIVFTRLTDLIFGRKNFGIQQIQKQWLCFLQKNFCTCSFGDVSLPR